MQLARHADHACVIHTWGQIPVLTSEECFFLLRFVPNLILTKKDDIYRYLFHSLIAFPDLCKLNK